MHSRVSKARSMRAGTSVSHACGSMPFILAVTISQHMAAARRPPRSEPQNNLAFLGGVREQVSVLLDRAALHRHTFSQE